MKYTYPLLLVGIALLFSCSKTVEERSSKDYLSAYLNGNKTALIFGKIDVDQLLNKADYKSIPKANVILTQELGQYKNALELEQGIHFVVEGPFSEHGPNQAIAFAKVKNADSLANKIGSLGLMLKESGGMRYAQDNEMSIGIQEHLALIIVREGKYDPKAVLEEAFKKCTGDLSTGKNEKVLAQKGDFIFGINMENSFANATELLKKMDARMTKEISALVSDSYLMGSLNFEKGQAVLVTENLFSDALNKRMFLNADPQQSILTKLGSGKAWAGISANFDIKKMESFVKDFSPEIQHQINQSMAQLSLLSFNGNANSISSVWNGQFGMVMVGEVVKGGGMVPEVNFNLGLGTEGASVSKSVANMFAKMEANGKVDYNGIRFDLKETDIFGTTAKASQTNEKLKIPSFADNYGKAGFSAFLDFSSMDLKEMYLDQEAKGLYALKNMTLEIDNQRSRLVLQGKDSSTNFLKQLIEVYIHEIEAEIN